MEKDWKESAARLFCLAVYIVGGYFAVKYLLPVLAPFVIAFCVAAAVSAAAKRISAIVGIPYGVCAAVLLTLMLALVGGLIFYACRSLVIELGQMLGALSTDGLDVLAPVFRMLEQIPIVGELVSDSEEYAHRELSPILSRTISAAWNAASSVLANVVRATPTALIGSIVTLISCYYMSIDFPKICAFFASVMPKRVGAWSGKLKNSTLKVAAGYLRAYTVLFILTFIEVLIGLFIVCPRYAWIGALAIAVVDILPVLGAGFVLIPWGVVSILDGQYFVGVGMLVIYVVVTVVRQIVEPRVIGKSIGVHPLAAVVGMFVGYELFGFAGMVLLPVALSVAIGAIREYTSN